jgi:hypothetical protein
MFAIFEGIRISLLTHDEIKVNNKGKDKDKDRL